MAWVNRQCLGRGDHEKRISNHKVLNFIRVNHCDVLRVMEGGTESFARYEINTLRYQLDAEGFVNNEHMLPLYMMEARWLFLSSSAIHVKSGDCYSDQDSGPVNTAGFELSNGLTQQTNVG